MRSKPWKAVFEWLSDQTGLPVIAEQLPTGTFSISSPPNKRYTLVHVIDLLNEALMGQKYVLIRGEKSFRLVATNKKIDQASLPQVKIEELGNRGRTELVSVELPLKRLEAGDIGPEVKKLLGPLGGISALGGPANRLLIHDRAGNLQRIVQTIKEVEEGNGPAKRP
jgi:hypothetical protein